MLHNAIRKPVFLPTLVCHHDFDFPSTDRHHADHPARSRRYGSGRRGQLHLHPPSLRLQPGKRLVQFKTKNVHVHGQISITSFSLAATIRSTSLI